MGISKGRFHFQGAIEKDKIWRTTQTEKNPDSITFWVSGFIFQYIKNTIVCWQLIAATMHVENIDIIMFTCVKVEHLCFTYLHRSFFETVLLSLFPCYETTWNCLVIYHSPFILPQRLKDHMKHWLEQKRGTVKWNIDMCNLINSWTCVWYISHIT